MRIVVDRLTHTYAPGTPLARTALHDVSLDIPAGQKVGLIGATGSGKSTLVQHIAGLLVPTSGRVLLDGTPAHQRTGAARALRRRIGLAFQYPEDQIFERTVFREVAFGLPSRAQLTADQRRARVHRALDQVGLDPSRVKDRSPLTLSGGEMRRVALASVLCTQPEILILDEPTAGLDPQGRETLLSSLQSWEAQNPHVTLLVISHNLDHLARLVDRAIVLVDGTLAAEGPAGRVLSDPGLLGDAGLQVPPAVELLHALREAGWDVQTDRFSAREAATEIARVRGLREGA
jgi:energy-coupling factor transport system ATP-binding protein